MKVAVFWNSLLIVMTIKAQPVSCAKYVGSEEDWWWTWKGRGRESVVEGVYIRNGRGGGEV
jgi:hypothetical protein